MNPEDLVAWESELLAETAGEGRERLNRLLIAEPERQAEWLAHHRLAIHFVGLAPRGDTAARVLTLIRAQRASRRHGLSRSVLRRRRPWRSRWIPALAVAAAIVVCAGIWLRAPAEDESPRLWRDGVPVGQSLAAVGVQVGPGELHWDDGSRAVMAPGSRVASLAGRGFRLLDGSVEVEVKPVPAPSFIVATPTAVVSVVGTRFSLAILPSATRVAVAEGAVSVSAGHQGEPYRVDAGEQWLVTAANGVQREQVDWRFTAGAIWSGEIVLGAVQGGVIATGLYLDDGPPKPCLQLEAPVGDHLFRWQPGQILTARLHLAAHRQRIGVQIYDRDQARNFIVYTWVTADDTGWADLDVSLDQVSPHIPGSVLLTGASIGHLMLVSEATEPPFQLRDLVVVHR